MLSKATARLWLLCARSSLSLMCELLNDGTIEEFNARVFSLLALPRRFALGTNTNTLSEGSVVASKSPQRMPIDKTCE